MWLLWKFLALKTVALFVSYCWKFIVRSIGKPYVVIHKHNFIRLDCSFYLL